MNEGRLCGVFDFTENVNHPADGVSFADIAVIKAERLEHIAFGTPFRLAQQAQIGVEAAMIFGNGHFVVVYDDDNVAAENGRIAQPFQRLAAAQRTVADDRYDIVFSPFKSRALAKPQARLTEVEVWPTLKKSCSLSSGLV